MRRGAMTIRRAEERDIDDIIRLLKQVNLIHYNGRPDIFNIGTKYLEHQLADIINDKNRPVLVADDGAVKGYVFCVLKDANENKIFTNIKTLYIDDLCVDEEWRGRHIGQMLFEAATELAKELNCYNVTLNVWTLNTGALRFYEACGMTPMKVCMEKKIL